MMISKISPLNHTPISKEMYNRQEALLEVAQNIRPQRQQKFEKQHQQKSINAKEI